MILVIFIFMLNEIRSNIYYLLLLWWSFFSLEYIEENFGKNGVLV